MLSIRPIIPDMETAKKRGAPGCGEQELALS